MRPTQEAVFNMLKTAARDLNQLMKDLDPKADRENLTVELAVLGALTQHLLHSQYLYQDIFVEILVESLIDLGEDPSEFIEPLNYLH